MSWFPITVAILGFFMIIWARHALQMMEESPNWSQTEGVVQVAEPRYDAYMIDLKYEFYVGGKRYEGSISNFGGIQQSDRKGMREKLVRYQPGQKVTVYYSRTDPKMNSLSRGEQRYEPLIVALIGCGLLVLAGVAGWIELTFEQSFLEWLRTYWATERDLMEIISKSNYAEI